VPRRAAADYGYPGHVVRRLRPPAELTADEKAIFLAIVGSNPASKFEPSDLFLLAAYVRALALEQRASAELRADGGVRDGKLSPWLSVLSQTTKSIIALAHRLRLSPQGRQPTLARRPVPASAYELMDLESGDDHDDGGAIIPGRP
jgi:phage terminase small subunit